MTVKVRKQIYIESEQEVLLKRLAQETGSSEAEIVRQAIERHTRELRPMHRVPGVWEQERAFILERMAKRPIAGRRTWRREDLHER